ncbi:MAG: ADP-ribosylglycohydrolase family protein [Anaerolineae bacterium]
MTDPMTLDRIRGCVVGAAVGDALGMPLEFGPKRPPDKLVCEMQPGRLPAGSFTDDTEMALALAESLLAHRPLDAGDLAARFVDWYRTSPPDVGLHTGAVLSRIGAGQPWVEAVEAVQKANPDSASNGSLMRAWPAAVAHWDNLDDLLVDSWQQSRVTHPHPDCLTACAFSNAIIYYLLRGVPPETAVILASSIVRTSDALWEVIRAAPYRDRGDLQNSGWVRHTLESALWGLLNTHSFEEAVTQVANLGADADTAAAVTGALAGACYGLQAIPARWRSALRGVWPPRSGTTWTVEHFISLADRLAGAQAAG